MYLDHEAEIMDDTCHLPGLTGAHVDASNFSGASAAIFDDLGKLCLEPFGQFRVLANHVCLLGRILGEVEQLEPWHFGVSQPRHVTIQEKKPANHLSFSTSFFNRCWWQHGLFSCSTQSKVIVLRFAGGRKGDFHILSLLDLITLSL